METAEEGNEMLVPIGSGSFIHAKLASKEKVVLNVGAGINIEKAPAEAKESLKARKAEVVEGSKKLNEMLGKIDQEMQRIQAIMEKFEESQQQGQGSEGVV
jgi:prefoldin alpha subunit